VFALGWDAPHRVLRSAIDAARALDGDVAGETAWGGEKRPIERYSVEPPGRETTGRIDAMALYAGQSVGAVLEVKPAREIVAELMDGAAELLARSAPAIRSHERDA
jgi:hypothetical protein